MPRPVRDDTSDEIQNYKTPMVSTQLSWDMQNLSLGMGSILQTLTEGSMSIYWLMALHAIDTNNTELFERVMTVLVKGYYTNFFFNADILVGLAVADTLQTRLFVKNFLPNCTGFIYFGNITDPVERLGPVAYIAFLNAHPNARWYTWSSRV